MISDYGSTSLKFNIPASGVLIKKVAAALKWVF